MSADTRHHTTEQSPNRQSVIFLKIADTKRRGVDVRIPPFHFPFNRIVTETSADHPHHSSIWEAPYEVTGEIFDAITDEVVRAGANVPGPVITEICQL